MCHAGLLNEVQALVTSLKPVSVAFYNLECNVLASLRQISTSVQQ
jgi:hypothetical protein